MKKNKKFIIPILQATGEAGTGKNVLNSSAFYEIMCQIEEEFGEVNKEIKCALIINHDEQITVYKQIAEKLGLTEKYDEVVYKPTRFINTHNTDDPVDVAFIDEAHLLWTQGKQSYQGKNQLQDILKRAKVTVFMFDENQIPTTSGYSLKIFDSPVKLDKEICKKAQNTDTALSRLIATYDWEYSTKKKQADRIQKYWEVMIDHWHKPWNRELERELSAKEKKICYLSKWSDRF